LDRADCPSLAKEKDRRSGPIPFLGCSLLPPAATRNRVALNGGDPRETREDGRTKVSPPSSGDRQSIQDGEKELQVMSQTFAIALIAALDACVIVALAGVCLIPFVMDKPRRIGYAWTTVPEMRAAIAEVVVPAVE
jgi:hypothetical protein